MWKMSEDLQGKIHKWETQGMWEKDSLWCWEEEKVKQQLDYEASDNDSNDDDDKGDKENEGCSSNKC